jgi:hypothetical protein
MAAQEKPELKMDPASLYLEEVFTDRRIGTIRRMSPVTRDGGPDATRKVQYVGEAQLLTPMGALPIAFEIEAASLGEAAGRIADGAKLATERAVKELQQMRREAASSIVVPQGGMGGLPGGGLGGGGKIQLP